MQTSKDQGIIHLPTASISFLNFLIFSKILVFTSQLQKFDPTATVCLVHFAESGGEHYITLAQISSNVVEFDITTYDANNTDTVNLDLALMTLITTMQLVSR